MQEYEWSGVVSTYEGRSHPRGEIFKLMPAQAAPLLAVRAIVPKAVAERARVLAAESEKKKLFKPWEDHLAAALDEVKADEEKALKKQEVKSNA